MSLKTAEMDSSFRIATCNIRYDSPEDGQHAWVARRPVLAQVLKGLAPDILGTQEGREKQIRELQKSLLPMALVDGHRTWIEERMYPSLMFNHSRMGVIDSGDIWLSETPEVPGSISFGSSWPKLCV